MEFVVVDDTLDFTKLKSHFPFIFTFTLSLSTINERHIVKLKIQIFIKF
jgi:hypothetical protein